MKWRKGIKRTVVVFAVGPIVLVAVLNSWVLLSTKSKIYSNINDLPDKEVALVLGTSDKMQSGQENPFFKSRIAMAANLYKQGKVKYVLVSGDNRSKYYNEPQKMRVALIEHGVPDNVITLDFAGLRTLDSIIRCSEIFGQNDFVIVTQKFHCYRALFISNHNEIEAIAMATSSLPFSTTFGVKTREVLARVVAIWDTIFIKTKPRHLGKKEMLNKGA